MEFAGYIGTAVEKAGGVQKLADALGVHRVDVSQAKAGKKGLPGFACVRLAQIIGEDERAVWAASELVTEKNPERRAVWLPFVEKVATSVLLGLYVAVTTLLTHTQESSAAERVPETSHVPNIHYRIIDI